MAFLGSARTQSPPRGGHLDGLLREVQLWTDTESALNPRSDSHAVVRLVPSAPAPLPRGESVPVQSRQ